MQNAFRGLVLERLLAYRARGQEGIPPYEDLSEPVDLKTEFSGIVRNSHYLTERMPQFAAYLEGYPRIQTATPSVDKLFKCHLINLLATDSQSRERSREWWHLCPVYVVSVGHACRRFGY